MKMSVETRLAVDLSVEHWNKIADGDQSEGTNASRCALCQRFNDSDCTREVDWTSVELCPIARHTGQDGCGGTPWRRAADEHSAAAEGYDVGNTCRVAMRDLLVSLPDAEEFNAED